MRDPKVRAWDTEAHAWVEGIELVIHTSGRLLRVPEHIILTWSTGLIDKQGKDIYDGDILKSYEGILWKVQWDNEKAEFELAWCGGPQPVYYRAGMYLVKDTHCEVIGNIYEQTELARGEQ